MEEIRRAFWSAFHKAGGLWFNYLGNDVECESDTLDYWERLVDELEENKK
jgi:hypothetical protein